MRGSKPHRWTRPLLLGLVATITVTGLTSLTLQPKADAIVGAKVSTEDYPFIVALKDSVNDLSFCTAVLIDPEWLATAAHCVRRSADGLIIRIGTADQTLGGSLVTAKRIVRAPEGDFALVQLIAPVPHQPIAIADSTPANARVLLLGFGLTCRVRGCGPTVKELRELESSIGSDRECRPSIRNSQSEMCIRNVEGKSGVCYGDSGGPAVIPSENGFLLAGVVNRGTTPLCGLGPDVYADVTSYKSFIADVIGRSPNLSPGKPPSGAQPGSSS